MKSAWLEVKKLGAAKDIPYLYMRWRSVLGIKRSRLIGPIVTELDGTVDVYPPSKAPDHWKPGRKAGRPRKESIVREQV